MNSEALKDELAVERTRLANERTFLAYVRTALALLAGGAALAQFFPGYAWVPGVAAILLFAGGITLAFGAYRFIVVRNRLNAK
ncbi:MAG: DUF202 domain-containing protein [Pseudomonadota bacterium]|nr:DUF202 domain-containing protein [Pseudomonadota bacterium]